MNRSKMGSTEQFEFEFELGGLYKLRLIRELTTEDEKKDDYSGHDILFDKKILKDGETMIFGVESRTYKVIEHHKGKIMKTNYKFDVSPNHFQGSLLYFPSFELMGNRTDMISVDCSSCMCRDRHRVKCKITKLSPEEIEELKKTIKEDKIYGSGSEGSEDSKEEEEQIQEESEDVD